MVRHAEQFYIVGSLFAVSGTIQAALGIHRPLGSPNFDQRDKTLFAFFLPHLRRALQVRERLAGAEAAVGAAFDALERSGMAALVAAGNGQILYANREAERLLHAGEGIAAVGGRLASARRPTNDRLLALIHASAETAADKGAAPGGILAIERDELAAADRAGRTVSAGQRRFWRSAACRDCVHSRSRTGKPGDPGPAKPVRPDAGRGRRRRAAQRG